MPEFPDYLVRLLDYQCSAMSQARPACPHCDPVIRGVDSVLECLVRSIEHALLATVDISIRHAVCMYCTYKYNSGVNLNCRPSLKQ
jgi:hypothetical protein